MYAERWGGVESKLSYCLLRSQPRYSGGPGMESLVCSFEGAVQTAGSSDRFCE